MKGLMLRAFSILMAIALWYLVNSESNLTLVSFLAPIELLSVPENRVVTLQSHRQAQVTVKGPAFLVSKLSTNPPIVRINAPKGVDSRLVMPLLKSELGLPQSVQIVSIEPAEVRFNFDKLVKKKVPIVVPRIGSLGESYIIRSVELVPSEVEISGPEGEIEGVTSIETYPLDLRTAREDFTRSINLRLPGSHIETNEAKVQVKVDIDLVILERNFSAVPVKILQVGDGQLSATMPETVSVLVSGPRELIKGLSSKELSPTITLTAASTSESYLVTVAVPEGVKVEQVTPAEVKLMAKKPVVAARKPQNKKK